MWPNCTKKWVRIPKKWSVPWTQDWKCHGVIGYSSCEQSHVLKPWVFFCFLSLWASFKCKREKHRQIHRHMHAHTLVHATWCMTAFIEPFYISGSYTHYNLILITQEYIRFISIKIFRNLIQTTQYKKENSLTYGTRKSRVIAGSRELNLSFSSSLPLSSVRFTLRQAFSKASSSFRSTSCQLSYSSTQLLFCLIIPWNIFNRSLIVPACHMHDLKTVPMANGCSALVVQMHIWIVKRTSAKITQVLLSKE